MDIINEYNKAINEALSAVDNRLKTLEAIDPTSNLIAGFETAYALLRGLLK